MPKRTGPAYHDRPPKIGPVAIWAFSRWLYARGWFRAAKCIKGLNFFMFRAVLPPEAVVGRNVRLEHYALGVVIHPNTVIGDDVRIYHQVTLGSNAEIGRGDKIIIGDRVLIGTGAKIINSRGRTLNIGDDASIGAQALVTRSVGPRERVRAPQGSCSPPQADCGPEPRP